MMRFILVADALTAHQVRQKLAAQQTTGVKVGNFSALLDTLLLQALRCILQTLTAHGKEVQMRTPMV